MSDTLYDLIMASATRSKAKRTKPTSDRPALPAKVEEQVAFYGLTTWAVYTLRAEFNYSLQDIVKLREKITPLPPWGDELGIPKPKQKIITFIPKVPKGAIPKKAKPKKPKPPPADPTRRSRRHAGQPPEMEGQDNPDKPAAPKKKKPHKYRPGAVALREIRRLQKSTKPLIPFLPFMRAVKQISRDYNKKITWSKVAVQTLQESAEQSIIRFMDDAYWCTRHAKRSTLMIKDFNLVQKIQGWQY